MPVNFNAAAFASQVLTGNLSYYTCYAASPLAFTQPSANPIESEELTRLVNIQITDNPLDGSQKNFEVLLMSISLRAMPVILSNPIPILDLTTVTNELSGEGFVWKFAVERHGQFKNYTPYGTPGPVGLLIDDLDGLVLPSGVRITTVSNSPSTWAQNISFTATEIL